MLLLVVLCVVVVGVAVVGAVNVAVAAAAAVGVVVVVGDACLCVRPWALVWLCCSARFSKNFKLLDCGRTLFFPLPK